MVQLRFIDDADLSDNFITLSSDEEEIVDDVSLYELDSENDE